MLLRERYVQGGNDAMKLMLIGRIRRGGAQPGVLRLHRRARAEIIREYQSSLARLGALKDKARVQRDNLSQVKSERVAQKKSLEDEKGARQQVLYKLSSRSQAAQGNRYPVRDEKRLTRLIERLARLAAAPKPQPRPTRAESEQVADASLAVSISIV